MGGGHNLSTPLYKNCGLKNKNIFYTPLKYKFHYTSVELKERLSKAWETIVVYTDTIPKLLFYLIVFTVALNLIAIMFGEKFFSAILFIAILLFSNTLILIQFLIKLYRSSDENTKQKISSIDKVIK